MSTRILLADDHAILREGLRALLEGRSLSVVAEAGDGRSAVRLAAETKPDVVVLDISMPELNGIDAAREILHGDPRAIVILLTVHAEEPFVIEALEAGARGYVLKSQASTDLVKAIQETVRGAIYLSPGVSQVVVKGCLSGSAPLEDPLTLREREVLQLIAEGRTTKEIALSLGVSVKTGESHRARLMKKLGIHHTAGLVRYAIRRGLIRP